MYNVMIYLGANIISCFLLIDNKKPREPQLLPKATEAKAGAGIGTRLPKPQISHSLPLFCPYSDNPIQPHLNNGKGVDSHHFSTTWGKRVCSIASHIQAVYGPGRVPHLLNRQPSHTPEKLGGFPSTLSEEQTLVLSP